MPNQLSGHYDTKFSSDWREDNSEVLRPIRYPMGRFEACIRLFPELFPGGDLLEIGSASGLLARSLIAAGLRFRTLTLTEFSNVALKSLAASFEDPRIKVRPFDAENPDTTLGPFDAILMLAVIEHLIDPLHAMATLRTLLKPGGFVWIDTPNIAKYSRRLKLLAGRFPSTASRNEGLTTFGGEQVNLHDEGHLHYFTFRSLERMLVDRCGFSKVTKIPYPIGPGISARADSALARMWPQMFSELCAVAFA